MLIPETGNPQREAQLNLGAPIRAVCPKALPCIHHNHQEKPTMSKRIVFKTSR